jgi:hypothetical protein
MSHLVVHHEISDGDRAGVGPRGRIAPFVDQFRPSDPINGKSLDAPKPRRREPRSARRVEPGPADSRGFFR